MAELSQSVREAKTKVVDSTKELLEDLGKTVSDAPASVKAGVSGKITDTADEITNFTNDKLNSISKTSEKVGDKVSEKMKSGSEKVKTKNFRYRRRSGLSIQYFDFLRKEHHQESVQVEITFKNLKIKKSCFQTIKATFFYYAK
jgi:hypothetical protein